jgi:hypothetical protein
MRRAKNDRSRTMLGPADAINEVRPIARALVEREERSLHSRMAAYERVASRVGASSSWLRKLIGRQDVSLAAHTYQNLKLAYARACERLEAEAEAEKRAFMALGGNDATSEGMGAEGLLESRSRADGVVAPDEE